MILSKTQAASLSMLDGHGELSTIWIGHQTGDELVALGFATKRTEDGVDAGDGFPYSCTYYSITEQGREWFGDPTKSIHKVNDHGKISIGRSQVEGCVACYDAVYEEQVIWEQGAVKLVKESVQHVYPGMYDATEPVIEIDVWESPPDCIRYVYVHPDHWGNEGRRQTLAEFGSSSMRDSILKAYETAMLEHIRASNICPCCLIKMDWISSWGDYSCPNTR